MQRRLYVLRKFILGKYNNFLTDQDVYQITISGVHREFRQVLQKYSEAELHHYFCVIEPNKYRIRHGNVKFFMKELQENIIDKGKEGSHFLKK